MIVRNIDAFRWIPLILFVFKCLQTAHDLAQIKLRVLLLLLVSFYTLFHHGEQVFILNGHLPFKYVVNLFSADYEVQIAIARGHYLIYI